MDRVAANRRVDFIVTVGDNFYERGVATVDDPLFRRSFETVYDLPALERLDWYATLGNHDYQGNYRAQIEYGNVNARWHMPAPYYSVSVPHDGDESVLLVFADSNPYVRSYQRRPEKYLGIGDAGPAAQLIWLEETLCGSSARWKFVFAHHPFVSRGHHGDTVELHESWWPILKECQADIYFAGHEHHLEYRELGPNLLQVISGAGSRLRPVEKSDQTAFVESELGFVWVSVARSSVSIEYVSHDGSTLFTSEWRRYR